MDTAGERCIGRGGRWDAGVAMAWVRWLVIVTVAVTIGCSRPPEKRAESLARSLGGRAVFDDDRLFRFEMQRSRIRDDDLGQLVGWVPEVEEIECTQTRITDQGVARLTGLGKLRKLTLSSTKITNAALGHLAGCPKLTDLYLVQTAIDDQAIDVLATMTNLRKLGLSGTDLSPAGVERLRESLPGATIFAEAIGTRSKSAGVKRTDGT